MITSSTIITLSLTIISVLLFGLAAWYWLPIWKDKQSGLAHALLLSNVLLFADVLFRSVHMTVHIFERDIGECQFNMAVAVIIFFLAIVQYALSRGYFNVE